MRGLLRIASARSPYMRAGLAWDQRLPVEVHVGTLDAARLRELLLDPVLTILVADEHGAFHALPTMDAKDLDDATLQMMIDASAEFAPAVERAGDVPDVAALQAEIERLRAISAAWQADQRYLQDNGFQSLADLIEAWTGRMQASIDLEAAQARHLQRIAELDVIVLRQADDLVAAADAATAAAKDRRTNPPRAKPKAA